MDYELVLIKPGELFLKSEPVMQSMMRQLCHNIKVALKDTDSSYDHIDKGRLIIIISTPEAEEIIDVLKDIPGISALSPAVEAGAKIDAISETALALLTDAGLSTEKSFCVRARRPDKKFELSSKQIEEQVGSFVKKSTSAKVDLENPDFQVDIEILGNQAIMYTKTVRGVDGLPVGVSGRVLVLMDDSPEALLSAFMMLRRGCEIIFLHFRTNELEHQRFRNNCEKLNRFAWGSRIKILTEKGALDIKRAEAIANSESCKAISICTEHAEKAAELAKSTNIPVFSPLIGFSKKELSALASKLFK